MIENSRYKSNNWKSNFNKHYYHTLKIKDAVLKIKIKIWKIPRSYLVNLTYMLYHVKNSIITVTYEFVTILKIKLLSILKIKRFVLKIQIFWILN